MSRAAYRKASAYRHERVRGAPSFQLATVPSNKQCKPAVTWQIAAALPGRSRHRTTAPGHVTASGSRRGSGVGVGGGVWGGEVVTCAAQSTQSRRQTFPPRRPDEGEGTWRWGRQPCEARRQPCEATGRPGDNADTKEDAGHGRQQKPTPFWQIILSVRFVHQRGSSELKRDPNKENGHHEKSFRKQDILGKMILLRY